jgi:hypothetical protein
MLSYPRVYEPAQSQQDPLNSGHRHIGYDPLLLHRSHYPSACSRPQCAHSNLYSDRNFHLYAHRDFKPNRYTIDDLHTFRYRNCHIYPNRNSHFHSYLDLGTDPHCLFHIYAAAIRHAHPIGDSHPLRDAFAYFHAVSEEQRM